METTDILQQKECHEEIYILKAYWDSGGKNKDGCGLNILEALVVRATDDSSLGWDSSNGTGLKWTDRMRIRK